MKNKKLLYGILVIFILAVAGGGLYIYVKKAGTAKEIKDFEDCAQAGYPVLESYPQQCEAPDGRIFIEIVTTEQPCVEEEERVNRNPGMGPTDRQCCLGLVEDRVSRSYSICRKPEKSAECIDEGSTLFPNDGNKCCAGLRSEWNYEMLEDGDCKIIQGTLGHQRICIKCRDGICGIGENGCNCPQDCKDFKCKAHGEIPRYTGLELDDMSIQCCEGLVHRIQKDLYDAECNETPYGGYGGICLACGDGRCDSQFESKCNCPEDCR